MIPPDSHSIEEQLQQLVKKKQAMYRAWHVADRRSPVDPSQIVYDGGSYLVLKNLTRVDLEPDRHRVERERWHRDRND